MLACSLSSFSVTYPNNNLKSFNRSDDNDSLVCFLFTRSASSFFFCCSCTMFSSIESTINKIERMTTFCDITNYLDVGSLTQTMHSIDSLLFNCWIPCWLKDKHMRCGGQVESVCQNGEKRNYPTPPALIETSITIVSGSVWKETIAVVLSIRFIDPSRREYPVFRFFNSIYSKLG